MDLSTDKSTAFIAGASYKDKKDRSEGTISAISFNRKLSVLCEKVLTEEKIQACTAMQRVIDKDDLVVGCYKHMFVIRYFDKNFTVLQKFKYVHSSKKIPLLFFLDVFSDLFLFKNRVFSVCRRDKYVSVLKLNKKV